MNYTLTLVEIEEESIETSQHVCSDTTILHSKICEFITLKIEENCIGIPKRYIKTGTTINYNQLVQPCLSIIQKDKPGVAIKVAMEDGFIESLILLYNEWDAELLLIDSNARERRYVCTIRNNE
jgi:hypothetical protein